MPLEVFQLPATLREQLIEFQNRQQCRPEGSGLAMSLLNIKGLEKPCDINLTPDHFLTTALKSSHLSCSVVKCVFYLVVYPDFLLFVKFALYQIR
jgi:hypothetical protein